MCARILLRTQNHPSTLNKHVFSNYLFIKNQFLILKSRYFFVMKRNIDLYFNLSLNFEGCYFDGSLIMLYAERPQRQDQH